MEIAVCLLMFVSACSGFIQGKTKWDDLRVTWGLNPLSSFRAQPITVEEAKADGFTLVGPDTCGATKSYNGIAYAKNGDYSLVLLFDVQGNIAGIQTAVSRDVTQQKGYPSEKIRPPFVLDGIKDERYVLTAYFTDPKNICTEGKTPNPFRDVNATDTLWLQFGETADTAKKIAKNEDEVEAPWVEGECFYTMGKHYWYNISPDMDCDSFFPVFLLYNDNKLNAFGWALGADLSSDHYEHPPKDSYERFMKEVPKCLAEQGKLSTMHIYLTSTPRRNTC